MRVIIMEEYLEKITIGHNLETTDGGAIFHV